MLNKAHLSVSRWATARRTRAGQFAAASFLCIPLPCTCNRGTCWAIMIITPTPVHRYGIKITWGAVDVRQDCSWQHPFRALCQGFLSSEVCRDGVVPPLYFQSSCVSAVIMSHLQISCPCYRETFMVDDIVLVTHLWVLVASVVLGGLFSIAASPAMSNV